MTARLLLAYIILLGITSRAANCQKECSCPDVDDLNRGSNLSGELFAPVLQPDIITYFNKDWLSGDIFLTDGGIIKNEKIKYNGLLDELLWLEPESNQPVKLDKEAIRRFHFLNFQGDTSVYFRKLKVKRDLLNDSIEIFGQELFNGNLSLFVLHNFYFDRREIVQMDRRYFLKDIYKEEPVYYIRFSDNKTAGFRNFSQKNLYELLPVNKEQIKKFFNEKRQWKIDTYPEIMSLIQFLNTIAD